jgi:hypothetical protein
MSVGFPGLESVAWCSYTPNVILDIDTAPSRPISPELAEMAMRAVKDFHECFWFRHPDADIVDVEDVEIVIEHLRRSGGHRAWQRSKELRLCL